VCAVIGAQWGDEGKGKIIDLLAPHFDVIARACGGANAGHTVVVSGKKHVFHLLPAGSLHAGKKIVLGAGMVLHLPTLLEEIRILEEGGISILPRLYISSAAHIVFDFHKELDSDLEEQRSQEKGKLGTTRRGIGPAYADKAARFGMRSEVLTRTDLGNEVKAMAEFERTMHGREVRVEQELQQLLEAARVLTQRIVTQERMFDLLMQETEHLLIEGAQGTLLDIDHGTYPYVTSSSTTAAGALQGLGLPPRSLTSCIGVAKAYCTRVGGGPFPTEETEEATAARLRERGWEYGSTTGRPRRCGWLHLPDLRTAASINGFAYWNITKLDVLDEEEVIRVGTAMSDHGDVTYKKFSGWRTSTAGVTSFESLPPEAKDYIHFIEEHTGIPVAFIGTGEERNAMIIQS